MNPRTRLFLALAVCSLVVVAAVFTKATIRAHAAAATRLLPDLELAKPDGMKVTIKKIGGRTHFLVGFISAAENVGAGPLVIRGSRSATTVPTMAASQVITMSDGSEQVVPDVGRLKYNVDPTHQHWHLQQFMTYELRRYPGYKLMRPGEKTGFCLGDRYTAPRDSDRKLPPLPAKPPRPVYTANCDPGDPQALSVEEGISVGYGDVYSAFRDGQQVDLTGLPAGMYWLVYRVNIPHRLVESSYRNNTSSLVFYLHWPHGTTRAPWVELRGRCGQGDHCRPQWGPGS